MQIGIPKEIKVEEQKAEKNDDLSQEMIKEILGKNTQFIIKTFREFQEKITSMEREITFMKNRMLNSSPTVKEVVSNVNPQTEQKSEEQTKEASGSENNNHPRSGNYKENDVSIEKFFYMGNK